MPLVNQLSTVITRIGTEFKQVYSRMGVLTALSTTDKSNLVAAINEVNAKSGTGGPITSAAITDATSVGKSVLTATNSAAARTAIGATSVGSSVLTASSAATARTAIGAVDAAAVDSRIQTVVGTAPAALDTLQELADALGGDANFSGTVTTALGNRVQVDAAQNFTAAQQSQGRANIGAAAAADIGNPETDFVAVFTAALA